MPASQSLARLLTESILTEIGKNWFGGLVIFSKKLETYSNALTLLVDQEETVRWSEGFYVLRTTSLDAPRSGHHLRNKDVLFGKLGGMFLTIHYFLPMIVDAHPFPNFPKTRFYSLHRQ